MDSSHYQQQHQQQQQHEHDPSQMQANDQSSQQYYYDYNNDNQQQHQFQQEPTSVHPPGVPISHEPADSAGPSQTQQLNPVQGATDAGSLNPETVAVVAGALPQQIAHYAGNVDGVQTAMYEQIGPSKYRGRGHRSGRPFRHGGRGHRGRGPYHGRGRGRVGDGRHFPSNVAEASADEAALGVQPESLVSGQPDLTQVLAAALQPPLAKLWCEICKAECNSPEMLQQHINGKRHKKNLLVHEELQRRKAVNEQQSGQISTSELNLTIQPENVQESGTDNLNDQTKLQNIVGGTSEVPDEAPEGEFSNNSAVEGCGFKHKMRRGRGSKYMRANNGSRIPVELKHAIYFICELCNVKCESQVVYNSHMTGKKHLSNFKRVHGHQGFNVEAGMQPIHPPDANALSNSNNSQVQQGVSDPQLLLAQLLMTVQSVLSQVQVPATALPSRPVAAQIQAADGSSHEHLHNLSQTQVSGSTAHVESENLNGETNIQLSSAPPELDNTAGPSNYTQTADGRSETEEKVL